MNRFEQLIQEFLQLGIPKGKFAIFGSGYLSALGLKDMNDLDVLVARDIFDEFKNKSNWTLKLGGGKSQILENGSIELIYEWYPGDWDTQKMISDAEEINGVAYVRPEEVLRWKRLRNKPKDKMDIVILERLLEKK